MPVATLPPPLPPGLACVQAAATAEQRYGLPAHLLLAIGLVESGQRDPGSGQRTPWPYSADAGGSDYIMHSGAEAATVVGFLRERGIASIDVGCFQVNLHYHPEAFASLDQAFDPVANADYAARFLRVLFAQGASWGWAIGAYHSADPALGGPYRDRVLAAWRGLGDAPPAPAAGAAAIPVYTPATLPAAQRAALRDWLRGLASRVR